LSDGAFPNLEAFVAAMQMFRTKKDTQVEESKKAREELAKAIRKELRSVQSRPERGRPFVSAASLQRVWSLERIREFLKGLGWKVEDQLGGVNKYLLKTLSVLVWVEWDDWDNFKNIFLVRDDRGTFVRCDYHIPFQNADFLGGDELTRQNFLEDQYLFKPVLIREDFHGVFDERWRLPFMESKEIGRGAFGAVTKENVEAKQLLWKKGGVNDNVRLPIFRNQPKDRLSLRSR